MLARYILLVPLFAALPASAGTGTSLAVSYADLNLASAQGQATLERRIRTAVRSVCQVNQSRDLAMRAASLECQHAARDAARLKMQVAVQRATSTNELAGVKAAPRL